MAGYVCIGMLAAFGTVCALWILWGWVLPRTSDGAAVLTGPLQGNALETARRWIWLREMGLLQSPLLAVAESVTDPEGNWLRCHGFEICTREEILTRFGMGENGFDRGFGDPPGRDQRRGVSEL